MLDNGGYVMINLTGDKVYDQALTCLKFKGDKAILVNDGTNVFFADTLSTDDTDIIITKGSTTYTIDEDGNVTTSTPETPSSLHMYYIHSGTKTSGLYELKLLSQKDNLSGDNITDDDINNVLCTFTYYRVDFDNDYYILGIGIYDNDNKNFDFIGFNKDDESVVKTIQGKNLTAIKTMTFEKLF